MNKITTKFYAFFRLPESPASKTEDVITLILFAIFAILFVYYQLVTASLHRLDAAFLMEVLTSIRTTGVPTTYLGPAFIDAAPTFNLSSEALCEADLVASARGLSVFDSHAYLILYPLSLLGWVFPPEAILAASNGLSFVATIFIVYSMLRRQGTHPVGAIATCCLVMAHPAWSHSSLGQFYADRFFLPLGLLYAVMLFDAFLRNDGVTRKYLVWTFLIGVLAASTTERAAIMIAAYTIACLFLFGKASGNARFKTLSLLFSVGLLIGVYAYVKLVYVYHDGTGSISSLAKQIPLFFENLRQVEYANKVREFLVINIVFFGVFAVFNWKGALIAFAAMMPNLLTTIGGAEKNGWATHYHTMYFPFLIFATVLGVSRLWVILGAAKYRWLLTMAIMTLIPVLSTYSPAYRAQRGAVQTIYDFYAKSPESSERQASELLRQVADVVPEGSIVTTTEGFFTVLRANRVLRYYPIGIDSADYAVLRKVMQTDGSFYYAGAVSYVGDVERKDKCLTDRLKHAGFNVYEPVLSTGGYAVLKRFGAR